MQFLQQLAAAGQAAEAHTGPGPLLETDARSGRRYLRLPVPDPQALGRLAAALAELLPPAQPADKR
jgi:hypothetical protein